MIVHPVFIIYMPEIILYGFRHIDCLIIVNNEK